MTDVNSEIKVAIEAFETKQKELDSFLKTAEGDLQSVGADAKEAAKIANEMAKDVKGHATRLFDLEQKLADSVVNQKESSQTLGEMLIKSASYKAFAEGSAAKARMEFKNTIIGQDAGGNSSNILVPQQRLPGIIPGSFRELRIRDAVPSGATGSNAIEYTKELSYTTAAAETAEGVLKPESDLIFELVQTPVRTIAHWIKLSKQVLDDAAQLASYVDGRLRYGVELRVDKQLLLGNGVGQNLSGMMNPGNFVSFTPTPGDTQLDNLNRAIYEIWEGDYAPTAMILSPSDWGAIERIKGDDEHYVIGNPQGTITRVLWGLPVVVSNAMPAGSFLMGAMPIAYQVWDRQSVVVELSEQDEDNFKTNLVTVRAEARLALAVYRPESTRSGLLVSGDPSAS